MYPDVVLGNASEAGFGTFTYVGVSTTSAEARLKGDGLTLGTGSITKAEITLRETTNNKILTLGIDAPTTKPTEISFKQGGDEIFNVGGGNINLTGQATITRPQPTMDNSQITNFNDYSYLTPAQMLSAITFDEGGTNRCYGQSVRMIAADNILAGRVVSLVDYLDNTTKLRVNYHQNGGIEQPTVYPIGGNTK